MRGIECAAIIQPGSTRNSQSTGIECRSRQMNSGAKSIANDAPTVQRDDDVQVAGVTLIRFVLFLPQKTGTR